MSTTDYAAKRSLLFFRAGIFLFRILAGQTPAGNFGGRCSLHFYPLVYVVNVKSPNGYFVLKTNKVNLHTDAEDDCCKVIETLVL